MQLQAGQGGQARCNNHNPICIMITAVGPGGQVEAGRRAEPPAVHLLAVVDARERDEKNRDRCTVTAIVSLDSSSGTRSCQVLHISGF